MDTNTKINPSFESLINDILLLDNIMLSVRSEGAVAEVKVEKGLPFRIREKWATLGDESGPWHIHINIEENMTAKFIKETMVNGRVSYSIRFFNLRGNLILRVNFVKMFDKNNHLIPENVANYENLQIKYGNNEILYLNTFTKTS